MHAELTRFKVKAGKAALVDEWLAFLNQHLKETAATLVGEKILIENIFSETIQGETYLYWMTIQENGGRSVEESEDWIDQKHLAYWDACIDDSVQPVNLKSRVTLLSPELFD